MPMAGEDRNPTGAISREGGRMKRAILERHLVLAEAHVVEEERHLARQREILNRLYQVGLGGSHTAKIARDLLGQMQDSLRTHIADRDRLRAALQR